MKVNIIGRQMNVWDDMKIIIEGKLQKFDKYFPDECAATVTLSCKHNQKCLEITIVASGTIFRSEVEDETFRNALDRAVYLIERQIRKNKTRLEKKLREGAFEREIKPMYMEPEEDEFAVIRTKKFPIKPMTVEEAILQMNLLEHEFFVFKNHEDEDAFSVVYRRKDGGYGLIASSDA